MMAEATSKRAFHTTIHSTNRWLQPIGSHVAMENVFRQQHVVDLTACMYSYCPLMVDKQNLI